MRTSLSCECGRAGGRGPVDCSGERTRDRLGPRFATAAVGRGTIGRGPVAVSAWLVATLLAMVRPDRIAACGGSRCIELTGESPVAVSAEAPRSRPRASRETSPSEWGVKSPQRVVRPVGGEQVRRPSIKRTLQPREIRTRKVGLAEPLMSRRRQQTALAIGSTQDARGVERTACGDSSIRNRRDPFPAAESGEGGPYKPMAKADRAGRESEGFIVPLMPTTNVGRGKEPCFGCGRVWR